jgi:hypothetical protein
MRFGIVKVVARILTEMAPRPARDNALTMAEGFTPPPGYERPGGATKRRCYAARFAGSADKNVGPPDLGRSPQATRRRPLRGLWQAALTDSQVKDPRRLSQKIFRNDWPPPNNTPVSASNRTQLFLKK